MVLVRAKVRARVRVSVRVSVRVNVGATRHVPCRRGKG